MFLDAGKIVTKDHHTNFYMLKATLSNFKSLEKNAEPWT